MKLRLSSDLGIRCLALVIAIALWFVAAGDMRNTSANLQERVLPATIRIVGVGAGLVPVTKPGNVEVRLRMPGGSDVPDQLDAYVDLAGRKTGEHRVPVHVTTSQLFTVVRINPDQVTVRLEREITRSFPVELAVIGLPAGTSISAHAPDPAVVALTGAESRVNQVARVIASVTYSPFTAPAVVTVRPVDSDGNEVPNVAIKPRQVKVTIDVPVPDIIAEELSPGQSAAQPPQPTTPGQQPQPALPKPTATPKPAPARQVLPAQTPATVTD